MLGFAIRGYFRGLLQEVFGIVGLLCGLWAAGWFARWVGAHWEGSQPAVVFWLLRWVLIIVCALTFSGLFGWGGRKFSEALREGWAGWVDRTAGVISGGVLGVVLATFVMLAALLAPWPSRMADVASQARLAAPLMEGGATTCQRVGSSIPGSDWLKRRFMAARARVVTAESTV